MSATKKMIASTIFYNFFPEKKWLFNSLWMLCAFAILPVFLSGCASAPGAKLDASRLEDSSAKYLSYRGKSNEFIQFKLADDRVDSVVVAEIGKEQLNAVYKKNKNGDGKVFLDCIVIRPSSFSPCDTDAASSMEGESVFADTNYSYGGAVFGLIMLPFVLIVDTVTLFQGGLLKYAFVTSNQNREINPAAVNSIGKAVAAERMKYFDTRLLVARPASNIGLVRDFAAEFPGYPGNVEMIQSLMNQATKQGDLNAVKEIVNTVKGGGAFKDNAIAWLRKLNSVEGYSVAHDLSNLNADAQTAKDLKRMREYENLIPNMMSATDVKVVSDFVANFSGYPKNSDVIKSIINRKANDGDVGAVKEIFKTVNGASEFKDDALMLLRTLNTFEGYSAAFDWSQSIDDAKAANKLAKTKPERIQLEHMALNLRPKKADAFDLNIHTILMGATTQQAPTYGWSSYNRRSATTTVKATINIKNDATVVPLKDGAYDVTINLTLSVPIRFMRRSVWLGNADENQVMTYTKTVVLRLNPPYYKESTSVAFDGVETTYKDLGDAGGTTERILNADPKIQGVITDVKAVI